MPEDRRLERLPADDPVFGLLRELAAQRMGPASPPPEPPSTPVVPPDPMALLRHDLRMPSLPENFVELQKVLADDHSSASDVASVISRDPGMSAFLLRLVNSAFYSFPSQVETISRAVALVGVRQISTLAAGTSVMDMFKDVDTGGLDMTGFWRHSVTCAAAAKEISRATGKGEPERCFTAGLLHDIGRVALNILAPREAAVCLARSRSAPQPLHQAEQALLDFDHGRLGGILLQKWHFPYALVASVSDHHAPEPDPELPDPCIIHCADLLAKCLGAYEEGNDILPAPVPEAWAFLGIGADALPGIIERADQDAVEFLGLLLTH